MFKRFLKKDKEEFLVLDFGSSTIKGLFFQKKDKKYYLKKFQTEQLNPIGVFQSKNFQTDLWKQTLAKLLHNLDLAHSFKGFTTILGLPGHILRPVVFNFSFERKQEEERINKKEKEKIIDNIKEQASRQLFELLKKENSADPLSFQILKYHILEQKMAGYRVRTMLGLRGKKLDLKVLVIFGQTAWLDFFQGLVGIFGLEKLVVSHLIEGLIRFRQLANCSSHLFIDIGSDFSQLFVFNYALVGAGLLKMGGSEFSKKIKKNFGLTDQETEALKILYSQGGLTREVEEKVAQSLESAYQLFSSQLESELKRLTRGIYLNKKEAFFFGGGSLLPGIDRAIKNSNLKNEKFNRLKGVFLEDKTGQAVSSRAVPALLLMLTA